MFKFSFTFGNWFWEVKKKLVKFTQIKLLNNEYQSGMPMSQFAIISRLLIYVMVKVAFLHWKNNLTNLETTAQ